MFKFPGELEPERNRVSGLPAPVSGTQQLDCSDSTSRLHFLPHLTSPPGEDGSPADSFNLRPFGGACVAASRLGFNLLLVNNW